MQDLLPANSDDNRFYNLPASGTAPCDGILWSGVAVQFPSQTSVQVLWVLLPYCDGIYQSAVWNCHRPGGLDRSHYILYTCHMSGYK